MKKIDNSVMFKKWLEEFGKTEANSLKRKRLLEGIKDNGELKLKKEPKRMCKICESLNQERVKIMKGKFNLKEKQNLRIIKKSLNAIYKKCEDTNCCLHSVFEIKPLKGQADMEGVVPPIK